MWSPRFHSNFRILRQEKVFSHLTLYTNDAGQSNYSWKTPNSVAREVQGCRWPKIQRNFPRMLNFWHTNIPLLIKRESLLHESGSFRVWGWLLRARAVQVGTRISLVPLYVTCMWHVLSLAHVARHYYSSLYDFMLYIGCTLDPPVTSWQTGGFKLRSTTPCNHCILTETYYPRTF